MRKKNAKFLFITVLFSVGYAGNITAQTEEKRQSAGDAFQNGYVGGDVGFSGSSCQVEYGIDETFTTESGDVTPTYYNMSQQPVTPPMSLAGEVLNFETQYAFNTGDFVSARGNQFRLDLIVGGNVHVGHDILLGGDILLRYTPGVISGFGGVSADITTDVIGPPVSVQDYTIGFFGNFVEHANRSQDIPCSFVYDTDGFTEVAIHNSWTVDFLLNVGYAFSPAVSFLLKAGLSLGFWRVDGSLDFSSTENLTWYNYTEMNPYPAPLETYFNAIHDFSYTSPNPEEVGEDFSENSTFTGLVLAPTVQMRISQGVIAFLKLELSLYGEKGFSFETENIGMVDMTVQKLNTVSGLVGIVYTLGGK